MSLRECCQSSPLFPRAYSKRQHGENICESVPISISFLIRQTGESNPKPVVLFNIYFLSFVGGFIHFFANRKYFDFSLLRVCSILLSLFFELKT